MDVFFHLKMVLLKECCNTIEYAYVTMNNEIMDKLTDDLILILVIHKVSSRRVIVQTKMEHLVRYRIKWFVAYMYCLEKKGISCKLHRQIIHHKLIDHSWVIDIYESTNVRPAYIWVLPSIFKYLFRLYVKTYFSRPLYEVCILSFSFFSSPIIRVPPDVQVLCQAAHNDIHFKTIIWKRRLNHKIQKWTAKGKYK